MFSTHAIKFAFKRKKAFAILVGLMLGPVAITYWNANKLSELYHIKTHNWKLRLTHQVHSMNLKPITSKNPVSYNMSTTVPTKLQERSNFRQDFPTTLKPQPPTTRPPSKLDNEQEINENELSNQNGQNNRHQNDLNRNDHNMSSNILDVKQLLKLIPHPKARNANCKKLFNNDEEEIKRVAELEKKNPKVPIPDNEYENLARDCDNFKKSRGYITQTLSTEEEEFSLAFSIMIFKDLEQVERLLRAIYMPQNFYCIHVDAKSSLAIKNSITAIAKCFNNVFLSSRQVDVEWAKFSVLEADLVCMEDLYKHNKKWKYFINLTGQEFPIKTNLDLVRILKIFNGAVNIEGTEKRRNVERTQVVHDGLNPKEPPIKKAPVPHNIRITKGSVHVVVPREFVEFVLESPIAQDFREWVKDTGVPDETFFSSLGHSPHIGVPGAYRGEPETNKDTYPFLARYKNWGTYPFDFPCAGKRVRFVCITSVGDLHIIKTRPEFFVNKFYIDYSPSAYDCLEEAHFEHIHGQLVNKYSIDLEYYKKFDFTHNHV